MQNRAQKPKMSVKKETKLLAKECVCKDTNLANEYLDSRVGDALKSRLWIKAALHIVLIK